MVHTRACSTRRERRAGGSQSATAARPVRPKTDRAGRATGQDTLVSTPAIMKAEMVMLVTATRVWTQTMARPMNGRECGANDERAEW